MTTDPTDLLRRIVATWDRPLAGPPYVESMHDLITEARAILAQPAPDNSRKGNVTLADHVDDSYGQCVVCRVYVPHTDGEFLTEPFPCPTLRLRAAQPEAAA